MELTYTTADGRLTIKIEGKTQQDLWQELARFQEVFDEQAMAMIDGKLVTSTDIKYRIRNSTFLDEKGKEQPATYYEKVCMSGPLQWYKKSFGVLNDKSGGLFPHKAPDGMIKGINNWHKYDKTNSKDTTKNDENVPY